MEFDMREFANTAINRMAAAQMLGTPKAKEEGEKTEVPDAKALPRPELPA